MGDSPLPEIEDKNLEEILEAFKDDSEGENEKENENENGVAEINSNKENQENDVVNNEENEEYSDDQVEKEEENKVEEDHPITQFFQKFKKKGMRPRNNVPSVALEVQ